jgi:hypothetical protein
MSVYSLHPASCIIHVQAKRSGSENRSAMDRGAFDQAARMLADWLVGFLRSRSLRLARLLHLESLSEHRLRDLGFLDGRGLPLRDRMRD